MNDEQLNALVEKLERVETYTYASGGKLTVTPGDVDMLAASAIRQLMRERDEAREVIRDLSRRNLEGPQSPF